MTTGTYYGPCDVRLGDEVMRLHCSLKRTDDEPAHGYVENRYDVPLYRIDGQRVLLCLPGGVNVDVEAGDIELRTNEPIGWRVEQYDPRARPDIDITRFGDRALWSWEGVAP